jgi:hypothetical protein
MLTAIKCEAVCSLRARRREISRIISILVVVSDGSWSVGVDWNLVRVLRSGVRRRLKVERLIFFLF